MRIAYLENRLTEVSKTFIRTEMDAVAVRGHDVRPFSVRRPAVHERTMTEPLMPSATTYLAQRGAGPLVEAVCREALAHPTRLLRAAGLVVAVSGTGVRARLRGLAQLAAGVHLGRILRDDRIDHLHNHAVHSAPVALVAATVAGIPYSITTHGPPEFDPPAEPHFEVHLARARFVAAISHVVRADVCRLSPPDLWDAVHVVRCGLPEAFLAAPPSDPSPEPRLVCVARLDERKGQPFLLEAMKRLVADGHDVRLVLVGDGPLRAGLESRVEGGVLRGRVRFTGWQPSEAVRAEVTAARAFVLPSLAEGLPVAIMEAMALGRPVVAPAVGAIHELVRPGETGWLVAPTDADALHAALEELLGTPTERLAEMGRQGGRLVRERHRAAREADTLLRLMGAGDGV